MEEKIQLPVGLDPEFAVHYEDGINFKKLIDSKCLIMVGSYVPLTIRPATWVSYSVSYDLGTPPPPLPPPTTITFTTYYCLAPE